MNNLLIIPSIDIKNGKTVRVVQGIPELHCKDYGNNPIDMALIWRAENAKCIHVVDFNCSQQKSHKNFELIENICDSVVIPVEVGGGVSTYEDAKQLMNLGVYRLIIGTMAHDNPKEFAKVLDHYGPKRIAAAIDVIDNNVVTHARGTNTGLAPADYAVKLKTLGTERFIVTDVKRNGMLQGPNVELSKSIAEKTGAKVTHSGGISGIKDLQKIMEYQKFGIDSVIIGRALYENKFQCQRVWRVAESGLFN
ncbi:MAG: 1-(5-phosphoribosyl)-5-[(5-phosphoribosylamino)methylideneamino] imidazole-4-carboxamide isomerase [Melioribacteraceae bacterium]|nr:1-(5-phosphoribosyl)-5-[(5-phosphoribosylamino)methylideneamino] imidazole-4-carboxamide isomerase [Melioribacteraceae bacterium]